MLPPNPHKQGQFTVISSLFSVKQVSSYYESRREERALAELPTFYPTIKFEVHLGNHSYPTLKVPDLLA